MTHRVIGKAAVFFFSVQFFSPKWTGVWFSFGKWQLCSPHFVTNVWLCSRQNLWVWQENERVGNWFWGGERQKAPLWLVGRPAAQQRAQSNQSQQMSSGAAADGISGADFRTLSHSSSLRPRWRSLQVTAVDSQDRRFPWRDAYLSGFTLKTTH